MSRKALILIITLLIITIALVHIAIMVTHYNEPGCAFYGNMAMKDVPAHCMSYWEHLH